MRQPEMNRAMQELCRRGWGKKQDLRKKGKGRPVHIYKPATQVSEIMNIFEQENTKKLKMLKMINQHLKILSKIDNIFPISFLFAILVEILINN